MGDLPIGYQDSALGKFMAGVKVNPETGKSITLFGASFNSVADQKESTFWVLPKNYEGQSSEFLATTLTSSQQNAIDAVLKAIENRKENSNFSADNRPIDLEAETMTREELQAHLDAQQARMEAMLAHQSADADRHLSRFEARLDQSLQQMHQDRQDQKEDARSTRNTVIGSALAILLSLFGAVYAIQSMNSSIIGNVISAFESGKSSSEKESSNAKPQSPASSASTSSK